VMIARPHAMSAALRHMLRAPRASTSRNVAWSSRWWPIMYFLPSRSELLPNLGDGRGQAAA
jgi:hypothetical protein